MKDLILEGNPPICLGCGLILTETPTFKLWLISTVDPLVLSMGILILSSLTHPLCGSPWKGPWTCWSLWKSSKISLLPVSPPRRPLQHLAGSDLWPHSCLFFFSVCVSSSDSRTPAWVHPPLNSNFLRPPTPLGSQLTLDRPRPASKGDRSPPRTISQHLQGPDQPRVGCTYCPDV